MPRQSPSVGSSRAAGPLRVRYNAVQDWSRDPASLCGTYPGTFRKHYQSPKSANSAAVNVVRQALLKEIEEDHEELLLDELDAIFPMGGDVPHAVQWDRANPLDGTVRIRALNVNRSEDVKVTAWVEKR